MCKAATTLIGHLTGEYIPSQLQDEYRLALEKVIEGKLMSQEPVVTVPSPAKGKTGDLKEALKASIAAAIKGATVSLPTNLLSIAKLTLRLPTAVRAGPSSRLLRDATGKVLS